ncbi:MAG TPA: WxcM-like domain-containing protein [Solirubrobacterales bacterium]|nr:WxcM-like domain-containing protein [Solirubrobacterales bacterium]
MADPFIHEKAICETDQIGDGTRIWAFAHVLPGAKVGADCNVCDGVFIEGGAIVGDRVTVKCGVQLWDGVTIEDDVFLGPNATFTNDPLPRSGQQPEEYAQTVVRRGASIGANATILPGLEIGPGAVVGAGAVVTRPVPANAIVIGNPAQIRGYAGSNGAAGTLTAPPPPEAGTTQLGVGEAHLRRISAFSDLRGSLAVGEMPGEDIPFTPRRWFVVHDVPGREVRGEHAHRSCHQFLVCVHGGVRVAVDDGTNRAEVDLDDPTLGVYVPPRVWASQFRYESDAVLLVFASDPYDPGDYIRDYGEFLAEVGAS